MTLLLIYSLIDLKLAKGNEYIEDSTFFKVFGNNEIKLLVSRVKKDTNKQNYLNNYLGFLNKSKDSLEKLTLISMALEYAVVNNLDINPKHFNNYTKLVSNNIGDNKLLTCFSMVYFFSMADNINADLGIISDQFTRKCEDAVEDYYYYTLDIIFNYIVIQSVNNSNLDIQVENLYKKLNKIDEYQIKSEFLYGTFYITKLNKSKSIDIINKIKKVKNESIINEIYYEILNLNFIQVFDETNYLSFLKGYNNLKNLYEKSSYPKDTTILEFELISILFKYELEKTRNNINKNLIKSVKKEIDNYFIDLNKLSLNQKNILLSANKAVLEITDEDLFKYPKEYFFEKLNSENFEVTNVGVANLVNKKLDIDVLFSEKKYKQIIDKYGHINEKDDLTLWDIVISHEVFKAHKELNNIEGSALVLNKNHIGLTKIFNNYNDYLSIKDDANNVLNSIIADAYSLYVMTLKQNRKKDYIEEQELAKDVIFELSQLKNYNEVSNTLRVLDLKLISNQMNVDNSVMKDFMGLENKLIKLYQNEETNYDQINITKIKLEKLQLKLNKALGNNNLHNPTSRERTVMRMNNDEAILFFTESEYRVYVNVLIRYLEGYAGHVTYFKKKDFVNWINLHENYQNLNITENNFKEFEEFIHLQSLHEMGIKKINVINSNISSKLIIEMLPFKDKKIIDFFSVNYLTSVKHYIKSKRKSSFRIGFEIDQEDKGIKLIRNVESLPHSYELLEGDTIIRINQFSAPKIDNFIKLIENTKVGESLDIVVLRNGKQVNLRIINNIKNNFDFDFVGFANPLFNDKKNTSINITSSILRSTENNRTSIKKLYQSLSNLDETEIEIQNALKIFKKNYLFLKKEASEKNFYFLNNKKIKILSMATHAIEKNSNLYIEPALVLSFDETESDYGLLTANEIASINIDAELVILSACNTASPGLNNELLLSGLTRAFLSVGAENLIVSRWPVDSIYTTEFMSLFYSHLNDKSYHESFYLSQKEMKNKYPDPYYWSSFIFLGI